MPIGYMNRRNLDDDMEYVDAAGVHRKKKRTDVPEVKGSASAAARAYQEQQAKAEAEARANEEKKNQALADAEREAQKRKQAEAASAYKAQKAEADAAALADQENRDRAYLEADRALAKKRKQAEAVSAYKAQKEEADAAAIADQENRDRAYLGADQAMAKKRKQAEADVQAYLKQGKALYGANTYRKYMPQRDAVNAYTRAYNKFLADLELSKVFYSEADYKQQKNLGDLYFGDVMRQNSEYGDYQDEAEYDAAQKEKEVGLQTKLSGLQTDADAKNTTADKMRNDGQYESQPDTLITLDEERENSQYDPNNTWVASDAGVNKESNRLDLADYMDADSDEAILRYLKQSAETAFPNLPDEATSSIAQGVLSKMKPGEKAAASRYIEQGYTYAARDYLNWMRMRGSPTTQEKYEGYKYNPAVTGDAPPPIINTLPDVVSQAAERAGWIPDMGGRGDDLKGMSNDLIALMTSYEIKGFTNAYANGYKLGGEKGAQAEVAAYLDSLMGELMDAYNRSYVGEQPLIDAENAAEYADWQVVDTQNELSVLQEMIRFEHYDEIVNQPDFAEKSKPGDGKTIEGVFDKDASDEVNVCTQKLTEKMVKQIGKGSKRREGLQYVDCYNAAEDISDDKRAKYHYLLHAEGEAAADQYLDDIAKTVWDEYAQRRVSEPGETEGENPFLETFQGLLEYPAAEIRANAAVDEMYGGKEWDPNDPLLVGRNRYKAILEDVSKDMPDSLKFIYNIATDVAEDSINSLIFSQGAVFAKMSNAAADVFDDSLKSHLTHDQAVKRAIIAGTTEMLLDFIGPDEGLELIGGGKTSRSKLGKTFLSMLGEGGKNVTSDAVNLVADWYISRDKSDVMELFHKYQKTMDDQMAWKSVARDLSIQLAESFASGATSEALSSGFKALTGLLKGGADGDTSDDGNRSNPSVGSDATSPDAGTFQMGTPDVDSDTAGVSAAQTAWLRQYGALAQLPQPVADAMVNGYGGDVDQGEYARSFSLLYGAGKRGFDFDETWDSGEYSGFDRNRAKLVYGLGDALKDMEAVDTDRPSALGQVGDSAAEPFGVDAMVDAVATGDIALTKDIHQSLVDASGADDPEGAVFKEAKPQLKEKYFELYQSRDIEGLAMMENAMSELNVSDTEMRQWLVSGCYGELEAAIKQGDLNGAQQQVAQLKEDLGRNDEMISASVKKRLTSEYVDMRLSGEGAGAEEMLKGILALDVGISRDYFQRAFEDVRKTKTTPREVRR